MFEPLGSIPLDFATDLIKEWLRLRQSKAEKDLETPEWQKLDREYVEHLQWRFRVNDRRTPSPDFGWAGQFEEVSWSTVSSFRAGGRRVYGSNAP